MPRINLSIDAESVSEFDQLIARFMPGMLVPADRFPPAPGAAPADEADKPATSRKRTTTKAEETPAATTPAAVAGAVDPFAAAATSSNAAGTASQAGASTGAETTSATPSATSPANDAATTGEVTIDMLKQAMGDLLKAKSASFAMSTLETVSGCKSLTTGSPSVVEKAKDDPALFRKVYDALTAAAKG